VIGWLLARPRLIAYGLGAIGLAAGLWWGAHTVSQWREAYRERPALLEARDRARAESAALVESARIMGEIVARSEDRIAEAAKSTGKVRTVYRDAVRDDPSCAAWAATKIACPMAGAP
jgi:hypothetical protein